MTRHRSAPAGLHPLLGRHRERRILRLKREIAVLEHIDGRLFRKALLWALLWIPLMALALVALSAKLHWWGASPTLVIAACVGLAAALFWIGRSTLWIPVIVIVVALAIVLEGGFDLPDWSSNEPSKPGKPSRQEKLDRALAKRRALLARLEGSA